MANTPKRFLAGLLSFVMLLGMVNVPVFAAETEVPVVTIDLIPGETTDGSATTDVTGGELTREVTATTSEIETTTKQTPGKMTAVQSALKFDRTSTADQKAQKVARELYTDTGHFADPSTITVTGAPAGYPFKYVGFGDYSGHYVSHVRVIYARDAAGNALKDANGNYVIDHLEHASSGTPLYYGTELTTNIDGPYHYATGTRSQQFLLMDEAGQTFYAYCIDLATGAESNTWYALANLEDNDYYATPEAENHVRGIVFNGYWGTESGTGSLASLKAALKAAVASGSVEDDYTIKMVNRKKFTTGYELQEGEYHYGSYVYWDIPAVDVTLTDKIIDAMTEGEALDAMQAAIWSWANGSQATLNGVDGVVVGDMSVASSAMSDSLNGKNDPEGAARTRALYAYLMQQTASADEEKTVIVNDKTFVEDMSLTIGTQISADAYEAELRISNSFTVDQNKDNLKIVLTYVDANGETQTIEKSLTGEGALVADEYGYYTIDGLKLSKANPFQFTLNIVGEQYLTKNAYIFTSEKGVNGSQTFVSMAEGNISVDVSKSVEVEFDVTTKVEPKDPPEHVVTPPDPTADKTSNKKDNGRFDVEIAVPGEDGDKRHDEVILMVDGSYSMDNEWPAMKEAIITIGKTVLNGSGTTQLTLMAFGMGDNEVLVHVKNADELAAALGELPGNLLYGRSSTNCEAGFTGVAEYIANHDETLNEVTVIFISDGNINTDETPRDFYFNWRKYATAFGALAPAQEAFCGTVDAGKLPAAFAKIFGNRFDGWSAEAIINATFDGSISDEDMLDFGDAVWAEVYADSGLIPGVEYPVSDVERAFVKYDKENGTYIQNLFYYTTYNSSYVTYGDRWTRTPVAAKALAAMDEVAKLYLVDYDSKSSWMELGVDNAEFVQSNGIAGLCEALQGALTDLAKTPFNDVVVTDYMSKWVNLDASTLKIVDNATGEIIWTAADGWKVDENRPTAQEVPVIVELVDPADYEAGGPDVIGNASGDIYKLTWYVKDGAMLRSDTYSLKYEVIVDTAEKGFVANTDYPANGNTDLHYTDENGEDQTVIIEVPPVDAEIPEGDIVVKKVDENGKPLTGAAFELFDAEGESLGEYTVNENGQIVFKDLKAGTYKLVETKTPAGYIGISEPIYFEVVFVNGECEAKDAYQLHFPATAYEISNHSFYPAIPQTFVMLDAENVDGWEYSETADFLAVYCGDSETSGENGTKYYRSSLEDVYGENAGKLRAIITNSYPYVSLEDMIAAATAAGVVDAENLTRGDVIAAVQLAIWKYTNNAEHTYRATYSVNAKPQWGLVFHDYEDELPSYLPTGNDKTTIQDTAGYARVEALFDYLIGLPAMTAGEGEFEAYAYVAEGGKSASQTMIGGEKPDFYTEGNVIVVKNVKEPAPPTVSFQSGEVSNISFMLIDKATGEITFLEKVDVDGQTSFEIPYEEGKISAVFVKQGNAQGMFWFSEQVSDDIVNATIECVDDNNPSYKGYSTVAFGAGDHSYEFKNGKMITYTFTGVAKVEASEAPVEPEATEPEATEPEATEPEATEPEATEPEINVTVKGAEEAARKVIDGVVVIYIKAEGKIPPVIWSSEELDDETIADLIDEFDAGSDVKVLSGAGEHKIEYQHNKNKTKTVTYTFEVK